MTASLRETDDLTDDSATLELTDLGLEVNDPSTGLTFYFSRGRSDSDAKIIEFAQDLIAEVIKTGGTLATEVSETETVTATLNPNGTIRSFITDKD